MPIEVDQETGKLHYNFPGEHLVSVGPIKGHVTTTDGEKVDVSPHYVLAKSPEHAAEIAHLVAQRYENEGHPDHRDDQPFIYTPTEG
jgi:hypothetical protein